MSGRTTDIGETKRTSRQDMGIRERMPHAAAFPQALGTGIIIRSARRIGAGEREAIGGFIDAYERTLSRFRADSTVAAMAAAERGGTFDFPDWANGLFDLVDTLADATDDAVDPCVGEDLIRLGYGSDYTFTLAADAEDRLGAIHGRPTWRGDVARRGATLATTRPVRLDFGAYGKGYLVDLIAGMLDAAIPAEEFIIDAGGDLRIRSATPVVIGLEDPADASRAVGTAAIRDGAFCASAPSRRRWRAAATFEAHHLINAIDGLPVRDVAATWVSVGVDSGYPTDVTDRGRRGADRGHDGLACNTCNRREAAASSPKPALADHPTALADGLATALFVTSARTLADRFPGRFGCAILHPDRTALASRGFPGRLFRR